MLEQQLDMSAPQAARRLLGAHLIRELNGQSVVVRIVETEAYDQTDAASHSFKGKTPRTDVMFGPAGHLYVYFTYGMHYCCNVVCGPTGEGAAVLIRAVEPLEGLAALRSYRQGQPDKQLTNGPAKLCQALNIAASLNGHDLGQSPLRLVLQSPMSDDDITQTTRIGISTAVDVRWRFYLTDSQYVSKR